MKRLALLLPFFVGLLSTACDRPLPRELAATTTFELAREHGRYVEADDLNLFTIVLGDGRDVILLHGNPTNAYTWRAIIEPLAERYRVHAVDLPGFGFSDKPAGIDYGTAWLARMVIAYMDAVGAPTAVLVGNSMGGAVATETAILYPARVDGLVLLAPAGLPAPGGDPLPLGLRIATWPVLGSILPYLPVRGMVRDVLREAVFDPELITDEVVDAYYLPLKSVGGARGFLSQMAEGPGEGRETLLAGIRAPTVVVVGDTDRLVDPWVGRRHHELIRGSRLVELEQTGHLPQEERPEIVIAEIFRLVDSLN